MYRKIICALLALALCLGLSLSVSAASSSDYLFDFANLLTDREEKDLREKLSDISAQYEAQIVIMTIDSTGGMDIDEFLEHIYDSTGFGYGPQHDGVLLLVCMDLREYRILSNGYAGYAIDPGDIEDIGNTIVPDLSGGDYAAAFDLFADACGYYLDGHVNGFPFDFGGNLLICLIIGIVVGLIVVFILKGQLNTIRKQDRAHAYMKSGSMKVNVMHDIFLYRNVSRVKRQTSSSSGSHGSSRSIGGGKF